MNQLEEKSNALEVRRRRTFFDCDSGSSGCAQTKVIAEKLASVMTGIARPLK
jgi:hypothetical protein